jgi:hypothetical protein
MPILDDIFKISIKKITPNDAAVNIKGRIINKTETG